MTDSRPDGRAVQCCVHIGLPKTATTMLQNFLFARHSEVEYLGYHHTEEHERFAKCRDATVQRLMEELLRKRGSGSDLKLCRRLFAESVQPALSEGRVPIWSWESLSLSSLRRRRIRARNLREVLGPSKVLIALRHPVSLVEAVYFQNIKRDTVGARSRWGREPQCPEFDQWLEAGFSGRGSVPIHHLQYVETIRAYAEIFGRDAVGILLFEQLVEDPRTFLHTLCAFVGIDPQEGVDLAWGRRDNVRWTRQQLENLRQAKRSWIASLRFRFASRDGRGKILGLQGDGAGSDGPKAEVNVSPRWRQRICEMTREGNRFLANEWDLPLARFGYPL